MARYGQRLRPPLIDATIVIDNDKFIFRVTSNCRQVRDLCVAMTCDTPTTPFSYVDTQDLSTIRSPMIDDSFLWWSRNDLFSRLGQAVARRLIYDYNEQSCVVTRNNDSQLMLMCSRLRGLMPDMVNSVSCKYDVVRSPIQDEDNHDSDSSDNKSVPALIERHLVDSDSDSSMEHRHLARRYGWHEGSSESSDNSSGPSLDCGSEDDARDLIPVGRGPFPSDDLSHHETSSVSSSATNCASSSSSDPSLRGINGSAADSIRLRHIDAFYEQLRQHTIEHAS
jgi:hypothetical protein